MMPIIRTIACVIFAGSLMAQAWAQDVAAAAPEAAGPRYCYDIANLELVAEGLETAPVCISAEDYNGGVCRAIEAYAVAWSLPADFLARLIWQESRFDPQAISPVGAQGIAQFMPGTARLRDLDNPFDPAEALARSAQYLKFLEQKFGNLGLAAAAYNGGEGRISRLTRVGGGLPYETRDYVSIITGQPIDYWLADAPEPVDYRLQPEMVFQDACVQMAKSVPMPRLDRDPGTWQPWGILVAQNFSAETARSRFDRVKSRFGKVLDGEKLMMITVRNPSFGTRRRHSAMIGRQSRAEAAALCAKLIAAGGNCVVQRNRE